MNYGLKHSFLILLLFIGLYGTAQNSPQKAKENFRAKNYQLTIDELTSISTSEINFDSLLFMKAYCQVKLKQLKEASQTISQLEQINPEFYEVHFLKGLIFAMKAKYPDAIEHFNKVLDKNPGYEKAIYNRALAKGLMEDYPAAIKDLNECLSIDTTYTMAYYNRGYWKELSGNYDEAITDYRKTIELDPHFSEAYIALGYIYSQRGDNASACEIIKKANTEGIEAARDLTKTFCNE